MRASLVSEVRIHPAIGIARVGNSEEYFTGPELPWRTPREEGFDFRDRNGYVKKQAARFRLFGYDSAGVCLGEITSRDADIEWTAEIANKKAIWYDFDIPLDLAAAAQTKCYRRNAANKYRSLLAIEGGVQSVTAGHPAASFNGAFGKERVPVHLGRMLFEPAGTLLLVPGHGRADSSPHSPPGTLNDNWFDDIADGPVDAVVRFKDDPTRPIAAEGAWVVSAPPSFAPDLVASQPLYDVIEDILRPELRGEKPSFVRHILPLFEQFIDAQWVNSAFAALFGWNGATDFMRPDFIARLAAAPGQDDPNRLLRRHIFECFRDPAATTFNQDAWPPLYGDVASQTEPYPPNQYLSVTALTYRRLARWALGDFNADYPADPHPGSIEEVPEAERPALLDRAHLHFCVGGPFHPGIELTWIMRRTSLYKLRGFLRLNRRKASCPDYGNVMTQQIVFSAVGPLSASGPGDLTKWMRIPWQSDDAACGAGDEAPKISPGVSPAYWPSKVPNHVLTPKLLQLVCDPAIPIEQRIEAFHRRETWSASAQDLIDRLETRGILTPHELPADLDVPDTAWVADRPV